MSEHYRLRALKCLHESCNGIERWKLNRKSMPSLKSAERFKVIAELLADGLMEEREIRRMEGAGPPGMLYRITDKGKAVYLKGKKKLRDGFHCAVN